jgi:hypothetical protein
MMMSPAASSTISESFTITSGTFQIICAIAVLAHLAIGLERDTALARCPILLAGAAARRARGIDALPTSHGRFMSREAICRSRRVRSMPTP